MDAESTANEISAEILDEPARSRAASLIGRTARLRQEEKRVRIAADRAFAKNQSLRRLIVNAPAGQEHFYLPEAVEAREALRKHPLVVAAIKEAWEVCLQCAQTRTSDERRPAPGADGGLSRSAYFDLYRKLYLHQAVVIGDVRVKPDDYHRIATEDWKRDSRGAAHVGPKAFHDAWFEWIDMHTDSIDASEYAQWSRETIACITKPTEPQSVGRPADPSAEDGQGGGGGVVLGGSASGAANDASNGRADDADLDGGDGSRVWCTDLELLMRIAKSREGRAAGLSIKRIGELMGCWQAGERRLAAGSGLPPPPELLSMPVPATGGTASGARPASATDAKTCRRPASSGTAVSPRRVSKELRPTPPASPAGSQRRLPPAAHRQSPAAARVVVVPPPRRRTATAEEMRAREKLAFEKAVTRSKQRRLKVAESSGVGGAAADVTGEVEAEECSHDESRPSTDDACACAEADDSREEAVAGEVDIHAGATAGTVSGRWCASAHATGRPTSGPPSGSNYVSRGGASVAVPTRPQTSPAAQRSLSAGVEPRMAIPSSGASAHSARGGCSAASANPAANAEASVPGSPPGPAVQATGPGVPTAGGSPPPASPQPFATAAGHSSFASPEAAATLTAADDGSGATAVPAPVYDDQTAITRLRECVQLWDSLPNSAGLPRLLSSPSAERMRRRDADARAAAVVREAAATAEARAAQQHAAQKSAAVERAAAVEAAMRSAREDQQRALMRFAPAGILPSPPASPDPRRPATARPFTRPHWQLPSAMVPAWVLDMERRTRLCSWWAEQGGFESSPIGATLPLVTEKRLRAMEAAGGGQYALRNGCVRGAIARLHRAVALAPREPAHWWLARDAKAADTPSVSLHQYESAQPLITLIQS